MRIVSIVGARPQFVKLAPVSRAMADAAVTGGQVIEDIIVHTGQHYDTGMSDVFFDELEIPKPSVHLGVGSGSHGAQTAKMLASIEEVLIDRQPDMVVIYGDTNSTLAGAVAAAKLDIPVAHIEAGLRSFNRKMPEEINRVASDHISDLLFAPTQTAIDNLQRENLGTRAFNSGDVMLDAVMFNRRLAEYQSDILRDLDLIEREYGVVTLHRASNTDVESLLAILQTLNRVAGDFLPLVFPVHPRTVAVLKESGSSWQPCDRLKLIEPVGYLDMLKLLGSSRLALTDSGGLQKEALFVGAPCVTLRDETEWPETIAAGGNILTGADPERITAAVEGWLGAELTAAGADNVSGPFGDGNAAEIIVRRLLS
jgi:UDP-N-acetylglucosamine 2-epimerase